MMESSTFILFVAVILTSRIRFTVTGETDINLVQGGHSTGKQGVWLSIFPDRENTRNIRNLIKTQGIWTKQENE